MDYENLYVMMEMTARAPDPALEDVDVWQSSVHLSYLRISGDWWVLK